MGGRWIEEMKDLMTEYHDEITSELQQEEKRNMKVDFMSNPEMSDFLMKEKNYDKMQRSIYEVPKLLTDVNSEAYIPKLVSLGPYHHGRQHLLDMERYKRLSCVRWLFRCAVSLEQVVDAMRSVTDSLLAAYGRLGISWANLKDDDRSLVKEEEFLRIMIVDCCFALEVMLAGISGRGAMESFRTRTMGLFPRDFKRDMLLLENQLPLVALHTLSRLKHQITLESLIERFFQVQLLESIDIEESGDLHILNLYRRGSRTQEETWWGYKENLHSATEISYSGISLSPSPTRNLRDISIKGRVLRLPPLRIDNDTESLLLNLMSFERLHPEAGDVVSAYAFFMNSLIYTSEDVALLRSKEIITGWLGNDDQVLNMFKRIIKGQSLHPLMMGSGLDDISATLNHHCARALTKFKADILRNSWKDPLSFSTFWLGVVIIFLLTLIQTVFAVLSYKPAQNSH